MNNKRVHNVEISETAAASFIEWSTNIAQKMSNADFEGKKVRRLVIDLTNQVRSGELSLESAENMFLMNTGLISLNQRSGFDL